MISESNQSASLDCAQVCHRGLVRDENQDSLGVAKTPSGTLFVVSDGVGGYAGGAEASHLITDEFPAYADRMPPQGDELAALDEMVRALNGRVYAHSQSAAPHLRRMSATVVMALVRTLAPAKAYIVNVGDSRAYLYRAGRLQQLSTDHTAAQVLVDAGTISADESRNHAQASVLTRSMGQRPEVSPSTTQVRLEPKDLLLLCSDGLHGYVEDAAIQQVLADTTLTVQARTDALLQLALDAGGGDNIAIQLISIVSVAPPRQDEAAVVSAAGGGTRAGAAPARLSGMQGLAAAVATTALIAAATVVGYHWWQSKLPASTKPPIISPANLPARPVATPAATPPASADVWRKATEPSKNRTHQARPAQRPKTQAAQPGSPAHLPSGPSRRATAVHDSFDHIISETQRAGDKVRKKLPQRADPEQKDSPPQP